MKIGDLRHRITLQKYIETTDDEGFSTQQWQDIATVWASVENLYGREYWQAAAIQAENTVKFTIRYRKDLSSDMRIKFQGQHYEIISIDNIKYKNEYIEIKAKAVEKE